MSCCAKRKISDCGPTVCGKKLIRGSSLPLRMTISPDTALTFQRFNEHLTNDCSASRQSAFLLACRGRRLVPVPGEDSRQNRQRSVKANIDADSQDAYANAARAGRVRRRPDSQIIGSPWPTSDLKTAAARGAPDTYSAPPTCTGAAADFTVFATKTRKVA